MHRWFYVVLMLVGSVSVYGQNDSYLFAWSGDDAKGSNDFLAVIDADAASPKYGQVVASVAVPGPGGMPHHTELQMPDGGFLLANAFDSGRTVLFDLNDPLHPKVVTSFGGFQGYMHPHTYVRLTNGDILATFQYRGGDDPKSEGGGLVEFDQHGEFSRASSALDPTMKGELIRPYSLVVIPTLDRIVSTNTAMHDTDGASRTVQVWQLSNLKLLKTVVLPAGPKGYEQKYPGEPELLADGKTVLVHTFACGLYEMQDLQKDQVSARYLKTLDGEQCDVPVRIGHYWVAAQSSVHAIAVYDIADLSHIREVSRVKFDDKQKPHWLSADQDGHRIVANSGEYGEHRLYVLNFDPQTGILQLDAKFHDPGSHKAGVSMDGKTWPHGFKGDAYAHGTVFSRSTNVVKRTSPGY
jgi:hypothetical protein